MNTEHENAVKQLAEKLTRIAQLEDEVAPKGVSFALRGQEKLAASSSNCVVTLRDPIAAANAVIGVLEDAQKLMSEVDKIAEEAVALQI